MPRSHFDDNSEDGFDHSASPRSRGSGIHSQDARSASLDSRMGSMRSMHSQDVRSRDTNSRSLSSRTAQSRGLDPESRPSIASRGRSFVPGMPNNHTSHQSGSRRNTLSHVGSATRSSHQQTIPGTNQSATNPGTFTGGINMPTQQFQALARQAQAADMVALKAQRRQENKQFLERVPWFFRWAAGRSKFGGP
jgi:hypothetical protein